MRVWKFFVPLFVIATCCCLSAQEKVASFENSQVPSPSDYQLSPGESPEIWLYLQQMRRYDDPKQAVRRKAEFRAAQRRNRLAAMKWFGLSNSRPQASAVPWSGTYSPQWSSNSWDRFGWAGVGR